MAAAEAAQRAARRAGVTILEIGSPAECDRAAELLRQVWRGSSQPVPANLLRTVQHTGGYVFGAYDDAGALLAVSMGLLAADGLHSHITGVSPQGQRRGLGFALKQHQRTWSLEHGIGTVTWTCDPLVRRNVMFNLHALGASVSAYLPDHYGAMDDGVNKGDATDRLELHWDLTSPSAVLAAEGRLPFLDGTDVPSAVGEGVDGLPELPEVHVVTGRRLVRLPHDIEGLRRADPTAARRWRHAVRDALHPALSHGAAIVGLTAPGDIVLEDPS